MFTDLSTYRAEQAAAESADQTEEECLASGSVPVDFGLGDEVLSDAVLDEQGSLILNSDAWVERDGKVDSGASEIASELARRVRVMGDAYPFTVSGGSLRYRGSKTLVYEFCLATARAKTITTGKYVRLPRNFERVTSVVMRGFAGSDAGSMRVGSPYDTGDPTKLRVRKTFLQKVDLLRRRGVADAEPIEEWVWAPQKGFEWLGEHAKDMGLDVIVWRDFPDMRSGRITMIGQCACGKGDLDDDSKMRETALDRYGPVFHPLTQATPLRFYAVPFHLPNEARFRWMHQISGLALDRGRLTMLAETDEIAKQVLTLQPRLERLVRLVIPTFQARR